MKIPTIIFAHNAYYKYLFHPDPAFTLSEMISMCKCADALVTLSAYEELFYRCCGVAAQYISNPVRQAQQGVYPVAAAHQDKIVVCCRLDEPVKNIGDCLRVLAEIIKTRPWTQMIFVGGFADNKGKQEFDRLAAELRVRANLKITGWTSDASVAMEGAAAILSCAYHEAFPLAISEAQSMGLPCVMYELNIMAAKDNPSIICVPQGDFRGAAKEILRLFEDKDHWRALSVAARDQTIRFSGSSHLTQLLELISHFQRQCSLRFYGAEDYRVVLRTLAFYGAHLPPWQIKQA